MKTLNLLLLIIMVSASSLFGQKKPQYDESKVPDYTLPELLKTSGGKTVTKKKQWEKIRRHEVLALFTNQVYGKTPDRKIPMQFHTQSIDKEALDGKATRKQVRIYFGRDTSRHMDLLIYFPNQVKAPVPVFLGLNFTGNHTIHTDPGILICPKKAGNERGMRVRRWPVEEILARGYGVATAWYGDIQPDLPDTFKEGVHQLFFKPGQRKPAPGEWGAIGAWAWGLSRAMRSEEHTSELQSLMRTSYAVFCLK